MNCIHFHWRERERKRMWNSWIGNGGGGISRREGEGLVAIAVDKDKGSQYALKWAVDHFVTAGLTLRLVHVNQRSPILPPFGNNDLPIRREPDNQTMDLFLPFRCFCLRRHLQCEVVVLEDPDIAKALVDYVYHYGVETLLLGSAHRNGFTRLFKKADIPSCVAKLAPDFCDVYVVSKGKITNIRAASRPLPILALAQRIQPHNLNDDPDSVASLPVSRGRGSNNIVQDELSEQDNEIISLPSFGRQSTDSAFLSFYENLGSELTPRSSNHLNEDPSFSRSMLVDFDSLYQSSSILQESGRRTPWLQQNMEQMEEKMRRLELDLKQAIEMYHAACEEALAEKQKAMELQQWKMEEEERLIEAQVAEKAAVAIAEEEKAKCKAAMEAAEAAQRMVEIELQKRLNAEMKALKEAEEKKKMLDALGHSNILLKYHSIFHILALLFLSMFLLIWN